MPIRLAKVQQKTEFARLHKGENISESLFAPHFNIS